MMKKKPGLLLPLFLVWGGFGMISCHREPIIIPDFNTATEQYIFAKNLKDTSYLEQRKNEKKETRQEAVIMAYQRVIARFPDDLRVTPIAWVDLGDLYLWVKDYQEALQVYETAMQKYPDQDDVICKSLFGAARAADGMKQYELALSYYKQCYERFENDKRPHLALIGKQARLYYSRIRIR